MLMEETMRRYSVFIAVMLLIAGVTGAAAQGNPTGGVSGVVQDGQGLPLPGVTVTVQSPVLQGTRDAVTSANGDYIIPFLPPGDYTITFELAGFQTLKQNLRIEMAATVPVSVKLQIATVTETVTVTAEATEIAQTATVAATYKSQLIESLPMGRTINSYALLAPGVTDNGPGGNVMVSGALSYENLFLVNGVVVNENLRGQARNLFIEDAIQETKVSTGSISAEYGRFQGGVVNTITKSGGNNLSGSFRVTFTNDSWAELTPYPGDENIDKTVPQYEATLGGPILRDKLWFFGAYRYENLEDNRTLPYTSYNYVRTDKEYRYEGKLSYAITPRHNTKAAYTKRRLDTLNNSFGTVMTPDTFYDNANDENLLSLNYTGVLTDKFFLEGQYSARQTSYLGTGASDTDLVKGTPIWDRSRGQVRYNSPTFCKVCGSGLEERDNWNAFAKGSYFLSTNRFGSHSFVAGFDTYKETRKNDNYQSGSSYRIQSSSAIIQGTTVYPVLKNDRTTYVDWLPLVNKSVGNDIRTYSVFLNDTWRYNSRFTFNIGVRYDKNNSKDQTGFKVVDDDAFSPRLGATWDVLGDGSWIVNGGFARYVMGVSTAIVDAGSAGGRTATFSYFYNGPNINTDPNAPLMTAAQALPIVFNWFNGAGGTSMATRTAPSVPGVTTKVGDGIVAPNSNEYSVGIARRLGAKGAMRIDYVYRDYRDFYGDFRNTGTGKVTDSTGRTYDLVVVNNTNTVDRSYKGLSTQVSYRLWPDLQLGGNYTLSWDKGNFTGEDEGSGPIRSNVDDFPEYRQASWNYPVGYNPSDQRNKVRVWASYRAPLPASVGTVDVGLVQRYDTGEAFSADGGVDPRPYVTNPGYTTPPSSVTYYFGPRGDLRTDNIWRTDLSFTWEWPLPFYKKGRTFVRGVVNNLFNHQRLDGVDDTVLTRTNNSAYQAFNPFTTTPIEGVHWDKGPLWGQPTGTGSYQIPREFYFSLGFRF